MLNKKDRASSSGNPPLPFPAAAPHMLWGLDREGMIGWVDPGRDPDPAWTPAGLIGRSVFAVLEGYPDLLDQVCLALSGTSAEEKIQRGDRSWICQLTPIRTGEVDYQQVLCLFTETSLQGRLWIQEALTGTAAALREARDHEDMPPLITRQLQALLGVERTILCLGDPPETPYQLLFSWGDWNSTIPGGRPLTGLLVDPEIIHNLNGRCRPLEELAILIRHTDPVYGAALTVGEQHLGALWVGRKNPLNPLECQLVHKLAEMTASALQRARQHEITSRRLKRLSALHAIERAISGSFNLNLTLHLILEQVVSQLEVDAADVVLSDSFSGEISFAAGQGFRRYHPRSGISEARERLIQSALIRRDLVVLQDLAKERPGLLRRGIFSLEGFRSYHAVPLIAKGRVMGVMEVYHHNPLREDEEWYTFLRTLGSQAAVAMDSAALVEDLRRTNLQLDQAYNTTLEGWVRALDMRDECTGEHTHRVVERSLKLARAVGIYEKELEHFRRGALLHDIGKLGVPDRILNKKGPLTDQERDLIRQHPIYAREMLEPIEFLHPALPIPTAHHERWDGGGYPDGLSGTEIPLEARIFAVIDVWDALSSPRPYREAWPAEKVHAYIREQAGKHFDPQIVAVWEKVFGIK
jgi:hypothetical protein